ncbi:hypothetical protein MYAM1_002810 [Malassezia yamatoensis]|uniref:Uncharacterized protein n=1 Tax=Malassezia yamatoensis TaxID=253288 RepID=A0AAJ6CIP9_9BASI|nr:hypothetical protein MYAM1_002810 [Malassezia yamatoensis]
MTRFTRVAMQKFAPRPPSSKPAPPTRPSFKNQKWTSQTMVMLSTSVGALMYFLGAMQGYRQGEANAIAQKALAESSSRLPVHNPQAELLTGTT